MITEFRKNIIIDSLNKIKEISNYIDKAYKLGIDLIEFQNGIDSLEKMIAINIMVTDEDYKMVLDMIQWWLYESVDKIIYEEHNEKKETVDVSSVENFVDWILEWSKR